MPGLEEDITIACWINRLDSPEAQRERFHQLDNFKRHKDSQDDGNQIIEQGTVAIAKD